MTLPILALVLASIAVMPFIGTDRTAACHAAGVEYAKARAQADDAARALGRCIATDRTPNSCTDEFAKMDLAHELVDRAAEGREACVRSPGQRDS
jgi:hypothetical protein